MKKLISLLLALCGLAGLATAQAGQLNDITLEEPPFAFRLIPVEGTAYAYGTPEGWTEEDLTEDERAWGYIGRWQSPDQRLLMEVALEDLTEDTTLAQMAELMQGWKGYYSVEMESINGRGFITFQRTGEDISGFFTMLDMEGGKPLLLRLDFKPIPTDVEQMMATAYIASLVSQVDGDGVEAE